MDGRSPDMAILIRCANRIAEKMQVPTPEEGCVRQVVEEVIARHDPAVAADEGLLMVSEAVNLILAHFESSLFLSPTYRGGSPIFNDPESQELARRGLFGSPASGA